MGYQGSFRSRNRWDVEDIILKLVSMKDATMELILDPEKYMEKYNRREIQRRLYYLKNKKFIAFPARSPKGQVLLTKLGLKRLRGMVNGGY